MLLEAADIDRYNLTARLRGLEVRGVDKASLARLIGVSLRTVQRWFAPVGGQYRPLIPSSWAGREFTTLRRGERLRVVLGALLAGEETRYCGLGIDLRDVQYLLRTLADALDAIDSLADGAGALWLVCNWRRASVRRAGEAWELVIEYEAERGEKSRGVEIAYGVMDEPPRRGEDCEAIDCPGDDWRRACCVLETRARCCAQARRVLGV
jgi:hypothetical protein